mgnify:CR=1 FL=1
MSALGAMKRSSGRRPAPEPKNTLRTPLRATCTGTAVFCAEQQIPCIYRAQAPPDVAPKVADPRTGRIEDANPLLLDRADWVCPSADDEGVATVIDAYLESIS